MKPTLSFLGTAPLVLAALLAGCSPRKTPPAPDHAATEPVAVTRAVQDSMAGRYSCTSNGGSYRVSFTPAPDPIPLNEMFTLAVWVAPSSGQRQAGGAPTLSVDAAMPEHDHGMNTRPLVAGQPDGSFRVSGMLFHMPGRWELYFDVTSGSSTERAQVEVKLE